MAESIGRGLLIQGLILIPTVNVFTSLMGIPVGSGPMMVYKIKIQIVSFSTLQMEAQVGQKNILPSRMLYSAFPFGMKTTVGLQQVIAFNIATIPILIQ